MIYGLAAALGFGLSDVGAAVVTRRVGAFVTVITSQFGALLVLLICFAIARPSLAVSGEDVGLLTLNGMMAAGGYLTFYRALEIGPIALVDPIASAYPAVTVALSVVLLNEALGGILLWGASLTIIGIVLASTDLKWGEIRRWGVWARWSGSGVRFALLAMIFFGVGTLILGSSSQRVGWLSALLIVRATMTGVLLVALQIQRRRGLWSGSLHDVAAGGLWAGVAVGVVDVLGDAMYARGSELGLVSITAAVSSTSTLIVVAGGVLLFRERPGIVQGAGVALVLVGLVFLGSA